MTAQNGSTTFDIDLAYVTGYSGSSAVVSRDVGLLQVTGTAKAGSLLQITAVGHGLATNDRVSITGLGGSGTTNGTFYVTAVISSTVFQYQQPEHS